MMLSVGQSSQADTQAGSRWDVVRPSQSASRGRDTQEAGTGSHWHTVSYRTTAHGSHASASGTHFG
jgi:hypothetical protein